MSSGKHLLSKQLKTKMGRLSHWMTLETVLLVIVLIGNAMWLNFCAFRGFYLFDFGLFLDASWRVASGQKPYVDFPFFTGSLHLYMLAIFFKLFGFGKFAILAHLVTISSTAIVAIFLAVRKKLPLMITTALIVLSATCFYTNRPHPWYDQSAHLWGILATSILLLQLPFQNQKKAFWSGLGCGAAALFALMTKMNIGLALGLVLLIILLLSSQRFPAMKGFVLGGILALGVFFTFFASPIALLDNIYQSFMYSEGANQSSRISRILPPSYWLKRNFWLLNFYWIPAMIVIANLRLPRKYDRTTPALFFGTAFVAIFSMHTGSERYLAYIPLMGIYTAIAFLILSLVEHERCNKKQLFLHKLSFCALLIFVLAEIIYTLSFGYIRATHESHPEIHLLRYRNGNYQLQTGPFKGWYFDEFTGKLLDQIVGYFNQFVSPEDTLLILTDLMIVNGLTQREPLRGIPPSFVAHATPVPGKEFNQVRNQIINNPPDWILLHKDDDYPVNPVYEYLDLGPGFLSAYMRVKTWGRYGLFKRAVT